MLRSNWLRLEITTNSFARSMKNNKMKYRKVTSRSIDRLISIMLRPSRLKKWAKRWMNSLSVKRKCLKSRNSKFQVTKMKLISEKRRSISLKEC